MNDLTKELRFITTPDLEIRATGDRKPIIRGYASVFNALSEDLGGFREIVSPGAFRDSLAGKSDVLATFNHATDKLLGRRSSGTLRLAEDFRGLTFEISPPDTSYARDLVESMRRGDINGASFGFVVKKDGQRWANENGQRVRYLLSVRLLDVAVVSEAAYPDASAALRSLAAHLARVGPPNANPLAGQRQRVNRAILRLAERRVTRSLFRTINTEKL